MKKIFFTLLASTALFSASSHAFFDGSFENGELYSEIFGAAEFLQTSRHDGVKPRFHPGILASASLGYSYCSGFRLEAEYAYRRASVRRVYIDGGYFSAHGHLLSQSIMANGFYEFDCSFWNIRPFVGAGIGYDFQRVHGDRGQFSFSEHKNGFAWQVMGGLAYRFCTNVDLTLEYRFHKGPIRNICNHAIGFGAIFKFGC